jgi:pantoate kinase
MARPSENRAAQGLQQIRRSIDVWRWTRLKRSPMPEELWAQAARLAQSLGVWPVARDLGLCYESLKRRVEERASRKETGAVQFVEMRGTDLMDMASSDGTVVELQATDGTRMRIRPGKNAQVDMTALIAAFRQYAG